MMKERQTLLDYAMDRQTKNTKDYPLIQELLFAKREKETSTSNEDQNKNQNIER